MLLRVPANVDRVGLGLDDDGAVQVGAPYRDAASGKVVEDLGVRVAVVVSASDADEREVRIEGVGEDGASIP